MNLKNLRYKGLQVAYYMICKRKLWLFSKGLNFEHTSEKVALGKLLDEISFKEEESYTDENVSIDFYTDKGKVVVHEVKLSDSLEEAHYWQVKYYLYYLKQKGIDIAYGVLHYPENRKIKKIFLEDKDEEKLENILKEIDIIINNNKSLPIEEKPYCKSCAYMEFCYG